MHLEMNFETTFLELNSFFCNDFERNTHWWLQPEISDQKKLPYVAKNVITPQKCHLKMASPPRMA